MLTEEQKKEMHDGFLVRLKDSLPAVSVVGYVCNALGFATQFPPFPHSRTFDERNQHKDSGDFTLILPMDGWKINLRMEVKCPGKENFSGPHDFKYHWADDSDFPREIKPIICKKSVFDLSKPTPAAIAIVSADLLHCFLVFGEDWRKWRLDYLRSSWTKTYADYYIAPPDGLLFFPLDVYNPPLHLKELFYQTALRNEDFWVKL